MPLYQTLFAMAISSVSLFGSDHGGSASKKATVVHTVPATKAYDMWNPKTVITFTGRVVGRQEYKPANSMFTFVDLLVKTKSGGLALVEVGPQKYVDQQRINLGMHDLVKVTGSKVVKDGDSFVLLSNLVRNGEHIAFRTQEGKPFWLHAAYTDLPQSSVPEGAAQSSDELRFQPSEDSGPRP